MEILGDVACIQARSETFFYLPINYRCRRLIGIK